MMRAPKEIHRLLKMRSPYPWGVSIASGSGSSADLDQAHHAQVLVVQDVAVVDRAAGEVAERDPDGDAAVGP